MSEVIEENALREGYKKAQIGPKSFEIPEEWSIETIPDLCNLDTESFDPSNHSKETFEYIDIESVSRGTIDQSKTIPVKDAPSRAQQIVKFGNTLVSKVRPYLQAFASVTEEHDGKVCSSGFAVLSAKEGVHSPYITQAVLSKYFLDQMTNRMTGTSYPSVNKSDFQNVQLFAPPYPEQRRIAEILSTVDEQIQQTESIIERLGELREGVSQDVFKDGFFEHTDKKETRIGPITHQCPSSWDEVKLADISKDITEIDHNMPDKTEEGIPFLTAGDVTGEWPPDFSTVERISKDEYERLKKGFDPEVGDIVYSRFGSGSIGVARKVEFTQPFIASYSVALIKRKKEVNVDYLVNLMNYSKFRQAANQLAVGAANTNLNLEEIRDLQLFLPQQEEQDRIGDLIATVNEKIREEKSALSSLQDLKRGLMQDLLTGKVRVNTD